MKKFINPALGDALFGRTRKNAIILLFGEPERSWHLRELARAADVSATMMGRIVDSFAEAGLVIDEQDGNRRIIQADPDCPLFDELAGIATTLGE